MKYLEKTIDPIKSSKLSNGVKYGLYLLVFLLPWQTRWIIKAGEIEYWAYSLYGIDVLLIVLLLMFIISTHLRQGSGGQEFSKVWYLIIVLDIFLFISIFFATDKWLAFYKYGWFLLGTGLFWLITSASYNKVKLLWSLLAGIFLQACFGVYQFLSQSSFASKWLGIAQHNPFELGASVVETIGADGIGERWLRAYGSLDHPNVLGGVIVVGVLLLIWLILRNAKQILNSLPCRQAGKLFYYFIILLFLLALFFTFSRGAWLALIAGILFMLFIFLIKKDYFAQREILKLILAGSILMVFFVSLFSNLVMTRLSNESRLEIKSNQERVEYLVQARDLIKSNLIFGVGLGNYTLVMAEKNSGLLIWDYQPVHNVFLLVWAEVGLLGLLGFLGFLGFLGLRLFKKKNYIGLVILVSLILMMMVDHWYWSLHFGILWFWLICGLILTNADV